MPLRFGEVAPTKLVASIVEDPDIVDNQYHPVRRRNDQRPVGNA
jgi:hypothetical protein